MFLEHSNFPAFSQIESCLQTDQFPQNSLHSRMSIICEYEHVAFCFPSRLQSIGKRPTSFLITQKQCRIEENVKRSCQATLHNPGSCLPGFLSWHLGCQDEKLTQVSTYLSLCSHGYQFMLKWNDDFLFSVVNLCIPMKIILLNSLNLFVFCSVMYRI